MDTIFDGNYPYVRPHPKHTHTHTHVIEGDPSKAVVDDTVWSLFSPPAVGHLYVPL